MKVRNKKTGEIAVIRETIHLTKENDICCGMGSYNSLAELNEQWEDYEEPKRHWIIDTMNDRVEDFDVPMTFNESIGNYFETKEEAEKAVEKLKAWKRLRDKGFRFVGVRTIGKVIDFDIPMGYYRAYWNEQFSNEKSLELFNDLKLLFGGEE